MLITKKNCAVLVAGALVALPAAAQLSAADLAKLGTTLTPIGAEKAGNAAGTIPAWDGGITKPVAGYVEEGHYPDPFAADKPMFTITGQNADQYKAQLSEGQVAMLKKYPDYKMIVYPTRRSASFPQCHYEETKQCAAKAQLAPNGNGVVGCTGGIPFPEPRNGNEAIWNTELRYRGDTYNVNWDQAAVTRGGDYALVKFQYEYDFQYGNCSKPQSQREPNMILNYVQNTTAPARLAGYILLVHETVDQAKEPRTAWTYNPGQRRVRLAPQVAYDNPGTAADGLRTNDDFGMFNGATDRYDWKLVGKKEMYIPYNSYKLSDPKVKYSDILKPGHINQDLARYELHRVWVVEATLKPGMSHIYAKRVFYIDEDSWAVVADDQYDGRGQLWRVAELHNENWYNVPMWYAGVEVHNDLQSGRYIAMGLANEVSVVYKPLKRTAGDYTPEALRGMGTR
ncbi:MAG TPA: DUF1329 domain-containing protein [Usitatibacter sp.]|jgi:hypothetical protein|nr:DUF1329 domain-containing protein [Usitatibacter sp.]